MKKSDYLRVLSLYRNSRVDLVTCIQLLIQMNKDKGDTAVTIMVFLNAIGVKFPSQEG